MFTAVACHMSYRGIYAPSFVLVVHRGLIYIETRHPLFQTPPGIHNEFPGLRSSHNTLFLNLLTPASLCALQHHASVSKRQSSGKYTDMRVIDKGPWGFTGEWPTGPRKGGLGAQRTLFQAPNLMRHTIDASDTRGFANITAVYGVPTTAGRCRLIVRQPFKFKNKAIKALFGIMPEFMSHLGNMTVLDDDNVFLHMQERESVMRGLSQKPIGQVYYMPGVSDAYVIQFRNWLENVAGGGPFGPQNETWLAKAGPRLRPDQLLDHYHSHVEKCSICKTALARIKIVQSFAAVAGVLGAVVSVATVTAQLAWARMASTSLHLYAAMPLVVGGAAVAFVAGIAWAWCSKTLPRFFRGERVPPRNKVPGEWAP
jgi:hypothetical protein